MNYSIILNQLLKAKAEKDIVNVIKGSELLDNVNNWKPLGGNIYNLSIALGQQPDPIGALMEKVANSFDAVLMKECCRKGLTQYKDSMKMAVGKLLGERYTNLGHLLHNERRLLADDIKVFVSENDGKAKETVISVYDKGEGQNPGDFSKTFLSLNAGNKQKTTYVHGRYNMGSTGALRFCGENNYQLLISRRNGTLINTDKNIGFTLLRSRKIDDNKDLTIEYCVGEDGNIMTVNEGVLNIDGIIFDYGTYVRMYNYELGYKKDISKQLRNHFNQYMFEPVMPIKIIDMSNKSKSYVTSGNKCVLDNMVKHGTSIKYEFNMNVSGYNLPVSVYVLDTKNNSFNKNLVKGKAVVYTVNGHTQYSRTNDYITYQLKYPYLAGNIIINVDCTAVAYLNIFSSNRSQMFDTTFTKKMQSTLKSILVNSVELQTENSKRANKDMAKIVASEAAMDKVKAMIKKNPALRDALFSEYSKPKGHVEHVTEHMRQGKEYFEGKEWPSFVRFNNAKSINLPLDGESVVKLTTDACDTYDKNNIICDVLDDNNEITGKISANVMALKNGVMTVLVKDCGVKETGENVILKVFMKNDVGLLQSSIKVNVVSPVKRSNSNLPIIMKVANADKENTDEEKIDMPRDKFVEIRTNENAEKVNVVLVNLNNELYQSIVCGANGASEKIENEYVERLYLHAINTFKIVKDMTKNEEKYKEMNISQKVQEVMNHTGIVVTTKLSELLHS